MHHLDKFRLVESLMQTRGLESCRYRTLLDAIKELDDSAPLRESLSPTCHDSEILYL